MSARLLGRDRDLSREIAKVIGPIVQQEVASWRYHMRTMATQTEDGTIPDSTVLTVGGSITREVADYLAVWLHGRESAPPGANQGERE